MAAIDLAGVGLAVAWWMAAGSRAGFWPLFVALAPALIRLLSGRPLWRPTPLDVPLLLFLATAAVGVWAAYDRQAAWEKFWLILGALLFFYTLARQPRSNLWLAAVGFAVMGVLAGAYFLLTHDWHLYPVKFALVDRVGKWWMGVRPSVGGPQFHPNVMAGLMAMLLPFTVACGFFAWSRRKLWAAVVATAAAGFTFLALLLTSSRGALLALVVALALWLLWELGRRVGPAVQLSRFQVFSLLLVPLVLLFVVAFVQSGGPAVLENQLPGAGGGTGTGRLALAGQTLELIGSFPFTGGGLESFPGLYSQYVLNIPFYVLPNGHNVFLDVGLEQGVFGLLAFSGVVLGAFWLLLRSASPDVEEPASLVLSYLRWAAASAFLVMLLHGLVEDTVYGSNGLPLLLLAPGIAVALNRPAQSSGGAWEGIWRRRSAAAVMGGLALVSVLSLVVPSWRAVWNANLGAVSMARVELTQWPAEEWTDGSHVAALGPAEAFFHRSLAADATNRTARYRLGLIAMMRRNYEEAVAHLSIAHASDANHQGIAKSLGYSHLWAGRPEDALQLLRGLPQVEGEVQAYVNWWRVHGREDLAERAADMAERLQRSSSAN